MNYRYSFTITIILKFHYSIFEHSFLLQQKENAFLLDCIIEYIDKDNGFYLYGLIINKFVFYMKGGGGGGSVNNCIYQLEWMPQWIFNTTLLVSKYIVVWITIFECVDSAEIQIERVDPHMKKDIAIW